MHIIFIRIFNYFDRYKKWCNITGEKKGLTNQRVKFNSGYTI